MPPSSKTSSVGRIFGLVFILVLIMVMAPAVSYLSVVFGWTNPTQTPPGGSGILTAYNGNLGINAATPSTSLTVGGTISAPIVTDLLAPTASSSAANKAYVDAAAGGAGSLLTIFDVYLLTDGPQIYLVRQGGAINAGCRGVYGNIYGPACTPRADIAAGSGISCPSGWTEVRAGYGPMNSMFTWYGTANGEASGDGSGGDPQEELDVPDTATIGTDSLCSDESYALMYSVTYAQNGLPNQNVFAGNSMLSACTPLGCNVCKVCIKD